MWFDYTHLSESERDQRFAEAYLKAYRHTFAKRTDVFSAPKRGSIRKKGAITKARQAADKHSIPYDYYCGYAITISDECQWKHLAQPNQLYSEAMQALVLDRWESHNKYFIVLPDAPCSSPEFHQYLKSAVSNHTNPQQLLYDLLHGRRLDVSTAIQLFPQRLLDRVRELEIICGAISA